MGICMAGGRPGATGTFEVVESRDLRARLAQAGDARIVQSVSEDVTGRARLPGASITALGEDQVLLSSFAGSGGFGDPLRRDPAHVARDVAGGHVSQGRAGEVYGTVLHDDGGVDAGATDLHRADMRRSRLAQGEAPQRPDPTTFTPAELVHSAGGALAVGRKRGGGEQDRHWACAACGQGLGTLADNHKLGCHCAAEPLLPGAGGIDYRMIDRTYNCPACGTAIAHEIARAGDPPFHNIELDAGSVLAHGHPPRSARA